MGLDRWERTKGVDREVRTEKCGQVGKDRAEDWEVMT